ncbi:hypothetical protein CMO89_03645 [Candidatus Woesearchaeota archaeon]|nr:hypothetical protein [Candidatus Woesearchaeota archaeon]|tara:strand:+ start:669 stop:1409 length:741 start_codon:yes stop_codon:yes gene_type:complete
MTDFKQLYQKNLAATKANIKESVTKDILIVQAISSIDELNKLINTLSKRIREWYSYCLPELEKAVESNEHFIKLILTKSRKEQLKEISLKEESSMGKEFSKTELSLLTDLAKELNNLYELKDTAEAYLEALVKELCPNMYALTGSQIGARLIEHAGSIKKLATISASQIQLLGAEKALFRHLRKGSLCPKYGFLHEHPLIQKARHSEHGKIARVLADKISIAVRIDFFKGKYIGDKLKKELEKKLS